MRSSCWKAHSAMACVVLVALLACGITSVNAQIAGVADDHVTIGSCLPQSGILKKRGEAILAGARSYFNHINDQGGIFGRKINLVACDDHYDPQKAIECFNGCLKGKVFAGAFFLGSPAISKYVRMTELDNMPMLGICTGTPSAYEFRPNVFALRPSYADEAHEQIQAFWNHGLRRFALIFQNDAAGAGVRRAINKELAARGTMPVAEASFGRTDVDIKPALDQIKKARPEVVLVVGAAGTVKTVKERYAQKWKIPFSTYDVQSHYFDGVQEGEGLVATRIFPDLSAHLPAIDEYKKLQSKYYPSLVASEPGLEGFINAKLIVEGLKSAGRNLTRANFVKALESMQGTDLGLGDNWLVSYGPHKHSALSSKAVHLVIMHGGKYVPLTEAEWKQVVNLSKQAS